MPKSEVIEPAFEPILGFAMNYNANVAMFIRTTPASVALVRITPYGLAYESCSTGTFLREYYRDVLEEEWYALLKFLKIALTRDGNDHLAVLTLMKGITMKLAELKTKTMDELVSMHNDLAKAAGVKAVDKFKSLEAGRIEVVKLANSAGAKPKTKEAGAATGGGAEGRPRTGVGAFAKEQILAGGSNSEVLEKVKGKFPGNATTVSCIAYYRNALVKAGQLQGGRKPAAEKPAKAEKAAKAEKPAKKAKK